MIVNGAADALGGVFHVCLDLPAWPVSLTFGLGQPLETVLHQVKVVFLTWLDTRFRNRVRILPNRAVHVAWE